MKNKMENSHIRLTTCDTLSKAHILKGRLESVGIPAFLTNEHFSNLMPHFNNVLGSGVHVFVQKKNIEAARAELSSELQPQLKSATCGNCGSENIGLGLGKKRPWKIVNVLISLLLYIPMGNVKSIYYCKDCGGEVFEENTSG